MKNCSAWQFQAHIARNGYNLEDNFGHGKQNHAAIMVSLKLLAFAIHTVCDIAHNLWRAFLIFPSWEDLLLTLAFTKPPPIPP